MIMSAVLLIYKRQNPYPINLLSLQIRLKKEIKIYYWVL